MPDWPKAVDSDGTGAAHAARRVRRFRDRSRYRYHGLHRIRSLVDALRIRQANHRDWFAAAAQHAQIRCETKLDRHHHVRHRRVLRAAYSARGSRSVFRRRTSPRKPSPENIRDHLQRFRLADVPTVGAAGRRGGMEASSVAAVRRYRRRDVHETSVHAAAEARSKRDSSSNRARLRSEEGLRGPLRERRARNSAGGFRCWKHAVDERNRMDPLAAVTEKARDGDLPDVTVREWRAAPRVVSDRFAGVGTRRGERADDDP